MKVMTNLVVITGCASVGWAQPVSVASMMPQAKDHTSSWWLEGFPQIVPGAPWKRCIQTGSYAMVLDTEKLEVSHLGPARPGDKNPLAVSSPSNIKLELALTKNGKRYQCTEGGKWSRFGGPRVIEAGRFMQRSDVTDLVFTAADGERLNLEARFETAAWPDRLALIFAARPGEQAIQKGDASFGKVGGGFGFDGTNQFEIPHEPALDPECFTLGLWAYIPTEYGRMPWLVCKNYHEAAEGNYGINIVNGAVRAVMNIGGGMQNSFVAPAPRNKVKFDAWNHLVMSYDGATLRLFVNGAEANAKTIGRKRVPGSRGLTIGGRQDGPNPMYQFHGVIDEIRFYDRAMKPEEIRQSFANPAAPNPQLTPVKEWGFHADGVAADTRPAEQWKDASMEIKLGSVKGAKMLSKRWELPPSAIWTSKDWHEVSLSFNPVNFQEENHTSLLVVKASEIPSGKACPVDYEPSRGWHRVNLDAVVPILPAGATAPSNDAIERVRLNLSNPTQGEKTVRLMFEKNQFSRLVRGSITGISAILRDADGNPTGIPVQLSKNWHNEPQGGVYSGHWFHGFSQMRLPAGGTADLELTMAYAHWGGVPAASHAQLSLIGWGSNQLWEQSALGSWGETICYEPDQAQANCTITDVRPVMVKSMNKNSQWGWTHNVGGGDFFRFFDPSGKRIPHAAMRSTSRRQGPCLSEVTYAGSIGSHLKHEMTVSLARTDDVVRGVYQIRMDVSKATDFSRFVIFQIGADTYSYTGERKMAMGDKGGLIKEWDTQWGGHTYRTGPIECRGQTPWVSLHQAVPREQAIGAWANRGIVIRSWKARFGGKVASPWIAEHGTTIGKNDSSTIDIVPPLGLTRLEPGDFVEATIEHIVVPQHAKDYYGPNQALRDALTRDENTWCMIGREAVQNEVVAKMETGSLLRLHPDVRVRANKGSARLTLSGGLGYIPVTFTGLPSHRGHVLKIDGVPLDQSIHGNDFWQTDYDSSTRSWSRTYNIPAASGKSRTIHLQSQP